MLLPLLLLSACFGVGRDATIIHTPKGWNGKKALPVVLVLHGGGGNAASTVPLTGMNRTADANQFIAVYPSGEGKLVLGRRVAAWNGGYCCGLSAESNVDDVGYLKSVIADVKKKHAVDPDRIYVTGISNGGVMAHRMAQAAPGLVAGIAAIGSPGPDAKFSMKQPVPTLIVHGTADKCALYEGGKKCGGCFAKAMEEAFGIKDKGDSHFPCQSAEDQAATWRKANGLTGGSTVTYSKGEVTCKTWKGKAPVGLCTIADGGHSWPSGKLDCKPGTKMCDALKRATGKITRDMGNQVIWDFFEAAAN